MSAGKNTRLEIKNLHTDCSIVNLRLGEKPGQRQRRNDMPLIQVKLIEGVFDAKQKKEIITKLTNAMVSVEGENLRPVTWVVIEEVRSGEWGIGGQGMTTEAVHELAGIRA
jgi:4-oxalocrotonate tautomerase